MSFGIPSSITAAIQRVDDIGGCEHDHERAEHLKQRVPIDDLASRKQAADTDGRNGGLDLNGREELDEVLPKLCDGHWDGALICHRTTTTDWRA